MDFSTSPATCGSGRRRHGPPPMPGRTSRRRRCPPAVLRLSAPRAPGSSPKEGHTCARPATATDTVRPLGRATPSAAPLGTWVSAAHPIPESEHTSDLGERGARNLDHLDEVLVCTEVVVPAGLG